MGFVRRNFISVTMSFNLFLHLATLPLTVAMTTLSARFDYSRHRVIRVRGIVLSRFWVFVLADLIQCQLVALQACVFSDFPSAGYQSGSARVRHP